MMDRDLIVEVCHDLTNRALKIRCDSFAPLASAEEFEAKEAAIRRMLAENERLREVLGEASQVMRGGKSACFALTAWIETDGEATATGWREVERRHDVAIARIDTLLSDRPTTSEVSEEEVEAVAYELYEAGNREPPLQNGRPWIERWHPAARRAIALGAKARTR